MYKVNTICRQILSGLLLALCGVSGTVALTSDREQPIQITADYVQINKKKGISEYRGNVVITQGSMKITGQRVTIHQPEGELKKIVVEGTPATFTQQPDGEPTPVFSQAQHMEYQAQAERIVLLRDASVRQGSQTFAGNRIVYNTRTSTVIAQGSDDDDKQRVRAVIVPQKDGAKKP